MNEARALTNALPLTVQQLRPGTRWSARYPIGAEVDGAFTVPGEWARVAARMRLTDSKLANFSDARLGPILQARYEVTPGTGPNAERNADYIRRAFGLAGKNSPRVCARSFESLVRSAALSLDDGFRVIEPLIGPGPDGLWWPVDFVDVESYSIWGFVRDETGRLRWVEQQLSQTGFGQPMGRLQVDAERVLVFTAGRTGDNYAGQGSLRRCYDWWVLKRDIPALARQAIARHAIPALVVTKSAAHLRDVEGWKDADISAAFAAADEAAGNLQSGESQYLIAAGTNGQGLGWSILGNGQAVNVDAFVKFTELADREMAAAFAASVVEMGTTGEGSRAIGEVHLDVLRSSLGNQLDVLLETICGPARPGGGLVGRLLDYNFGPQATEELPQIVHRGLEVNGLADALGALPSLTAAGLLDPSAVRDSVLRLLGVEPVLTTPSANEQPVPASPPVSLEGVPVVGGGGRPEGT